MLEKLEQEHKERLERQQKQYEDYMKHLEEKMKQRLDDFLTSSTHLRSDTFNQSIDSQSGRYRTSSTNTQYRPLARDFNLSNDLHQSNGSNSLSRTHSREDISK